MTVAGPVETAQRFAERRRSQRALAVGQVLRLVAVRVGDVGEVDVERRAGLQHRVRAGEDLGERPRSVKPPSVTACRCAKSSTGRTQPQRSEISNTSAAVPSSRTRPMISTPNGNRAILLLEPLAQLAELLDDGVDRVLALAAEQEAGVEDDRLGPRGPRDAGRVVEHPDGHVQLLAALGVAHEAGDRRVDGEDDASARASSPKRSAHG